MRILLADDSVTAQNMGKKILTEAGHEVICVSNGAAALKKVGEQDPGLVILDIYMPGYGGLEVCQRLKENPATAGIPVVLTVGKLEPFRKEDAQRVRAEALIVKPFEASELQAAVARFSEMAASAPAKPKSRGKQVLQPPAQPEQFSEDDYVTASQRESQKEEPETAPATPAVKVAAAPEPPPEMQGETAAETREEAPAGASEFEVTPDAAQFPAAAETGGGLTVTFALEASAQTAESNWAASAPAEFNVQAEEPVSPQGETEIRPTEDKAAAAAAGADFGGIGEMPAPASAVTTHDFAAPAPSAPEIPQASAFTPQIAANAPSLPGVPEFSSAAVPGFGAAGEEPAATPEVDPAFDPDRTQWATQFATRFGIQEEAPAEQAEPEKSAEPEATSMPPEEIAAILSNLPGGMGNSEAVKQPEAGEQYGQRPWPAEPAVPADVNWKAEEVPVEDQDSSVSLAEEMEKAFGAADRPLSSLSAAETQPTRVEANPAVSPAPAEELAPSPVEASEAIQTSTEETGAGFGETQGPSFGGAPPAPEVKAAEPAAPDRVAGVMQSAAMAIATRATVSAVASQLHTSPSAESVTTGSSTIEELVGQVLERLKPKLIAEIKRELKNTEEK